MCILCGDYVDCLNVLSILVTGSFSFVSKLFIHEICVVVFVLATRTLIGATFDPFCCDVVKEELIF